ncbi:MAG: hypothetical protein H7067_17640 [Burkholderiales bacterium]|nr:hypothetical protein [Opitutaceae bacterium]
MSTSIPPASAVAAHPSVPKTPFLAAAALFLGVAALIGALAIRPLGAAELLGLLACTAAAAVFATIPFAIDLTRRLDANRVLIKSEPITDQPATEVCNPYGYKSALDPEALAASIATAVEARLDARLAAAEETRRAEIQAAIAATTPPRIHDADTIAPPASAASSATGASAKPRLGRGLLGLMHAPSPPRSPHPHQKAQSRAEHGQARQQRRPKRRNHVTSAERGAGLEQHKIDNEQSQ